MCFLLHISYVEKHHSLLAVFFQSDPSPRGLCHEIAAAQFLVLQVRIRRGNRYLSLVNVVCYVGTGFCDWPIPSPGESY